VIPACHEPLPELGLVLQIQLKLVQVIDKLQQLLPVTYNIFFTYMADTTKNKSGTRPTSQFGEYFQGNKEKLSILF